MSTPMANPVMIRREPGWRPLSLEDVAARCGLHPLLVERFVAIGLITPLEGESNRFAPEVTLRLQRALRLNRGGTRWIWLARSCRSGSSASTTSTRCRSARSATPTAPCSRRRRATTCAR